MIKKELKNKCSKCNSKFHLIKHHPDYSKPDDTIILCSSCHSKLHIELNKKGIDLRSNQYYKNRYERLSVSSLTKRLLKDKCIPKFLKKNPQYNGMNITEDFITNQIVLFYLEAIIKNPDPSKK